MQIRIHSYLAASFLLEKEPSRWDTLAILDSDAVASDFLESHACRHTFLRFDDIQVERAGRRLVTQGDIRRAIDFATNSNRLLVSCRAGQSRSVAIAYLIACHLHGIAAGLELLDPTRHMPNSFVVRTGAMALDEPEAHNAFENWRRDHHRTSLSDYYDEIEREFDELELRGAVNKITST